MINPLDALKTWVRDRIEEAKLALHIQIDEEAAEVILSRLLTLNPDTQRQADYQAALTALKGK